MRPWPCTALRKKRTTTSFDHRKCRFGRYQPRLEILERRELLSITTATGTTITPVEGTALTGAVATFTSPDNGPFTATIDWGDGTTDTVSGSSISGGPSPAAFSVTGTHTYAEDGSDPISVVISDTSDSKMGTATGTANIAEAGLTISGIAPVTVPEGVMESGFVATFTDPGSTDPASDFSGTINWGDGTTDSGAAVTITGGSGT